MPNNEIIIRNPQVSIKRLVQRPENKKKQQKNKRNETQKKRQIQINKRLSDKPTLRIQRSIQDISRIGYFNANGKLKNNLVLEDFVSPINLVIPKNPYVIVDSPTKHVYDLKDLKRLFYRGSSPHKNPFTRKNFNTIMELPKEAQNKLNQLKTLQNIKDKIQKAKQILFSQ